MDGRKMSDLQIPDPEVECWDYAFSQRAQDLLWIAHPSGNPESVVTSNVNNWWRHLLCADTREGLDADITKLLEEEEVDPTSFPPLEFKQVPLGEVLSAWRMIRYNGRVVCATECADMSPTHPSAFPEGPVAPVRNGFLYMAVQRSTGKPFHRRHIGTKILPVTTHSINTLISDITDAERNSKAVTPEEAFSDYWIVAVNLLEAAIEWPLIEYNGRLFPLFPVMQLNPNHNGDPEEQTLANT